MAITIRPASLPDDIPGIDAVDTSFETEAIYDVRVDGLSIAVEKQPIPRRTKSFGVYDLRHDGRQWDEGHVALDGEAIVGFSCSSYQFWNRRVVLWHIYVQPDYRSRGLGHQLIAPVFERAKAKKAYSVFLETSNYNAPGIDWYQRQGFTLGGVDTTLYNATGTAPEKAIYLVKRL